MENQRYKAFISYSHSDERWAKWLQRSIERYRVPRRLAGKQGAHGEVPARLTPVFRDREDLSSASDLTGIIKQELENAEFLVVICSPAAAASRWVGEEVRYFRELGRDDRVLALVVDGDPHIGGNGENCFPPALLESREETVREPLAADVRRYADGKHLALLKIVAGLLGVRLDELRRRDAHRRLQQRLTWGVATVILVGTLGWLLYSQAATRAAAQVQRVNTEELLSYMLGDLQRLDSIAGVENLVFDRGQYDELSESLGLSVLDSATLLRRAMAWRETGLEHRWEGRLNAALEHYRNSHAALMELHRREGGTERVLFELGQAEFYMGEVLVEMGEAERTREHWTRYGALTRRLLNREPNNPKYVMELSYTLMNLGALEHVLVVPDADKSLELLQASLQYNQMALVLDPDNPEYLDSLPGQLAWLADTLLLSCSLGDALKTRHENVGLRRGLAADNPDDAYYRRELAFSLTGLAGVQQQIGLANEAVASFEEAAGLLREIHQAEPGNEDIEWEYLYRSTRLARLLFEMGEWDRAADIIEPFSGRILELGDASGSLDLEQSVEAAMFGLDYARMLKTRGESGAADQWLRSSIDRLTGLVRENPGDNFSHRNFVFASFLYWEQFGSFPPGAPELLARGLQSHTAEIENCYSADLAARLAVAEGDTVRAREYVDYVLSKGYFAPDFITFCKQYGLCELP